MNLGVSRINRTFVNDHPNVIRGLATGSGLLMTDLAAAPFELPEAISSWSASSYGARVPHKCSSGR
jgi:hypothetical protein